MSLVDSRRVQILTGGEAGIGQGPVVYVMAREQRVSDNWALLYALEEANKKQVPLVVLFALAPMFSHGSARHNEWMVQSLQEVADDLKKYDIPFFVRLGDWIDTIPGFAKELNISKVVFDFNPLPPVRAWRQAVAGALSSVAEVVMVDARNIVPCWWASPKAEFAAYTFRPKVTRCLADFLVEFPKVSQPDKLFTRPVPAIDWEAIQAFRQCDYNEVIPKIYTPGNRAGMSMLHEFVATRLSGYAHRRNDPNEAGISNLSPYLRWGNISSARVALTVRASEAPSEDKQAFLEELIVRRELADNYVYYTKYPTQVSSAHPWAQATLQEHVKDPREYTYTYEMFRDAKTHDSLWNAAQLQMVHEGKMHGFLRMYWAKKILEWSTDPQTAVDIALRLNDHYQLDGRDSNGVVGVMWSIAGVHDRAWTERPVFGKIRYMNYNGCKRKFNVAAFEQKYLASGLFTL
jgi:deoxyribodipyrimidine photo-lyase